MRGREGDGLNDLETRVIYREIEKDREIKRERWRERDTVKGRQRQIEPRDLSERYIERDR